MTIELIDVSYIYKPGTLYEVLALRDINLKVSKGEFLGIIGPTGSGKSTLAQHFNGLLKPIRGKVYVDGVDLSSKQVDFKSIRQKVGLVFQYPEHQLFEETVYDDIAFGPRNMGLDEKEIKSRVEEALKIVDLNYQKIHRRSPFELSGGEMRRVAIAGVLALRPQILVLDEPTAGLDPLGRREILKEVKRMHEKLGITVVFISHNMEEVARLVNRLVVMDKGAIILEGSPREIFSHVEELKRIGLSIPKVTELMRRLKEKGRDVPIDVLTIPEAAREIAKRLLKVAKQ